MRDFKSPSDHSDWLYFNTGLHKTDRVLTSPLNNIFQNGNNHFHCQGTYNYIPHSLLQYDLTASSYKHRHYNYILNLLYALVLILFLKKENMLIFFSSTKGYVPEPLPSWMSCENEFTQLNHPITNATFPFPLASISSISQSKSFWKTSHVLLADLVSEELNQFFKYLISILKSSCLIYRSWLIFCTFLFFCFLLP